MGKLEKGLFIFGLGTFIVEAGLGLTGYINVPLGIGLTSLGVLLWIAFGVLVWKGRQAKPILSNRDALIRAIGEVRQRTVDLISRQEALDIASKRSPNIIDTELIRLLDDVYAGYKKAMDELQKEKLVAGEAYQETLNSLVTFISFQVMCLVNKPVQVGGDDKPLALQGYRLIARLGESVDKTISEINRLSQ